MKTCAFTGHRVIKSEHGEKVARLLSRALNYAYNSGCRRFLCGGAVGFDTVAALEVLKFREKHGDVTLVIAAPCREQDAKWSFEHKHIYREILDRADEVLFISDVYTPDCMKKRNLYLAENADILIAYVQNRRSGAGQTYTMAKQAQKEVHNLYYALENEK